MREGLKVPNILYIYTYIYIVFGFKEYTYVYVDVSLSHVSKLRGKRTEKPRERSGWAGPRKRRRCFSGRLGVAVRRRRR